MTTTTNFTGITYATDGDPNATWNGVAGLHAPVIVTYSFVETADIGPWQATSSYANNGYTSFTAAQRANFRDALAEYSKAAGIVFVEATSGQGMINAMDTSGSGWGGWANVAYSTETYTGHGELIVDNSGAYDEGTYGFQTMLHELGHAMGLQHPWEGSVTLDPLVDDQWHTVMTYNNSYPYTDHLGTLDVAAMRYLYGAASATAGWAVALVGGVLHVTGSARGDVLQGIDVRNSLGGGLGADKIYGREATDTLHGGFGNDVLSGHGGSDDVFGDAGNDVLYGYAAQNAWDSGTDHLFGGLGDDRLYGGYNGDNLFGGAGNDLLGGSRGDDTLHGGDGADSLYGGIETDAYGRDLLYGELGNDLIKGGLGDDTGYGGSGNDQLFGEEGSDSLYGGLGGDRLDGGTGWDTIYGDEGNDFVAGGDDSDQLYGGAGNDTIYGGSGFDTLDGGAGNDVLVGVGVSGSSDTLTGGEGADRFVFLATDMGGEFHLTDFTRGSDVLDLRNMHVAFGDITFQGSFFHIGTMWVQTAVAAQLTAADFLL